MATPRRRINGVPFPGHRGTRIPAPDPASRRAQRTSGPTGPGGGGGGGKKELNTGCVFLFVLVLTALAIVAYVFLTR